ncbi:MAG: lipoyl(octanoyl) transferase LipB, partial [Gemmatimonadota bacterium]
MSRFRVVSFDAPVPYRAGLEWQRDVAERRIEGELEDDLLVLLEHEPVLTLGRNADDGHVTADPDRLERLGVERVEVERGGDVTYHGPGQLVGYPIFDLRNHRKDLHWFLRRLEAALIGTLDALGLDGFRVEGHTGVWVGEADGDVAEEDAPPLVADGRVRKVASIGIHVSRWVS